MKFELISGKRRDRIRLSGELRCQDIDQVKAEITSAAVRVLFSIWRKWISWISKAFGFLNLCYAEGIGLAPLLTLREEMDAPRACRYGEELEAWWDGNRTEDGNDIERMMSKPVGSSVPPFHKRDGNCQDTRFLGRHLAFKAATAVSSRTSRTVKGA